MSNLQLETPLRLDHLAIWVADIDETAKFLGEVLGFKRHPSIIEVDEDDPTVGGMEAHFFDGIGLWYELIYPTAPGPGMDVLHEVGDGAIVEANFEAVNKDYMKIIDAMAARDIQMEAMDGSPIVDGGRIFEGVRGQEETAETGQYISFWPQDVSCGSKIEIYEKLEDDETNLLNVRDELWKDEPRDPKGGPRIDHITIVVEDIDKAINFYTEYLDLKVGSGEYDTDGRTVFINTNETAWIRLLQPTSGHALTLLKEKGSGFIMETAIEVDDLDAFYDQMQANSITMVDIDGSALPTGTKAVTVEPYGDRYNYFPLNVSRGMRLRIFERYSSTSSIYHQRDAG